MFNRRFPAAPSIGAEAHPHVPIANHARYNSDAACVASLAHDAGVPAGDSVIMQCLGCGRPWDGRGNGDRCDRCAAEFRETRAAEPGSPDRAGAEKAAGESGRAGEFARYRLLERIGQGGMGTVWSAHDLRLGRRVALKQLRGFAAGDDVLRARFFREAQMAARLRHPGIVAVHDVGEEAGIPFLAMEQVDGRSFAAMLREDPGEKTGRFRPPAARGREALAILAATAEAIAFAHAEGVIHRDLKPANVLIAEGPGEVGSRVRVTDFGLAREMVAAEGEVRITASGQALGTPAYMSPEQAQGLMQQVGPAADVWALGAMLYEILTGDPPFERAGVVETMRAVVNEEPIPPRRRNPEISEDLEAVCLAALEKDPGRRLAGAGAFAQELRRWLAGEPVRTRKVGRAARFGRRLSRARGWLLAGLGVAAAMGAAAGWVAWDRARLAEQRRELRVQIQQGLAAFESQILKTDVPPEARDALAAQTLAWIDRWIAEEPRAGVAHSLRGRIRELMGRRKVALADFDLGCSLSPEAGRTWFLRGMFRLREYLEKRVEGVESSTGGRVEFHAPTEETPGQVRLRDEGLANLTRAEAAADAAESDWAITADEIRLGQAVLACARGREEGWTEALNRVEGLSGPTAGWVRGHSLRRLGRIRDSVAALDRAVEEFPFDGALRHARGLALVQEAHQSRVSGRDSRPTAARAREDFEIAVRLLPGGFPQRFGLGRSLLELAHGTRIAGGDPSEAHRAAQRVFAEVVGDEPKSSVAWLALASTYQAMAEWEVRQAADPRFLFDQAISSVSLSIEFGAPAAHLHTNRAMLLQRRGEVEVLHGGDPVLFYQRAAEDLQAAIAFGDESPTVRLALGNLHARWGVELMRRGTDPTGRFDLALAELDQAIALAPDRAEAYGSRGGVWSHRASWEKQVGRDPRPALIRAVDSLDAAVVRNPSLREARFQRAFNRAEWATCEAAAGADPAELQRQVEEELRPLFGADPRARILLAQSLASWGQEEAAIRLYEEIAREQPRDADLARGRIEEIRERRGGPPSIWEADFSRGDLALSERNVLVAWNAYQQGVQRWQEDTDDLAEDVRERRRADPEMRNRLATVYYNMSRAAAQISIGRTQPGVADAALGEPERRRCQEAAFDTLRLAREHGFLDFGHAEQDADLEPLRSHPQWQEWLDSLRGK